MTSEIYMNQRYYLIYLKYKKNLGTPSYFVSPILRFRFQIHSASDVCAVRSENSSKAKIAAFGYCQ